PSLDGVAFIDPRGSQVEIIQAVGRAIRKVRGAKVQKKGTIVLPVFIEDGDNHEASIEASNFKPVWDVLKALRAHDEVLADTLDQYRTNMAKNASQSRESISDKIIFDMPVSVDAQFSSALRAVLVEASTASWEFWFGLLENYILENKDSYVPAKFVAKSGHALGNWVSTQRLGKLLTQEKSVRLESLDHWVWDVFEGRWSEGYNQLLLHLSHGGSCLVPTHFKTPEGFALGHWIANQRNRKNKLDRQKENLLSRLSGWIWEPNEYLWNEGYQKLLAFSIDYGHSNVPTNFKSDDGFKLGHWVDRQRQSKTVLSKKRENLLSTLPDWTWHSLDTKWINALMALIQFVETNELHELSANYVTSDGIELGKWLRIQLSNKKNISPERKKSLEAIPGWDWSIKGIVWKHGYSRLCAYIASNKGELPSQSYIDVGNFKLGSWVQQQRTYQSSLSLKQKKELEKISGWFWSISEKTDQYFVTGRAEIIRFAKEHGHSKVPQRHVTSSGFKLGTWLSNIRVKRKSLPIEIIEELQKIDGWSWSPREDSWNSGIASLQKFSNEFGHAAPSKSYIDKDGFKLGAWVSECRTSQKSLSQDRVTSLEILPGWVWNAMEAKWLNDVSEFEAYIKKFNSPKVLISYVSPTGFKLGLWCKSIRRRKNKITPDRIKTLDSLGFIWDAKKDKT
ncbi:Helicase associated domain protein, partial [bacterium]|nr:Helicase associated domain protein [bacterium]